MSPPSRMWEHFNDMRGDMSASPGPQTPNQVMLALFSRQCYQLHPILFLITEAMLILGILTSVEVELLSEHSFREPYSGIADK